MARKTGMLERRTREKALAVERAGQQAILDRLHEHAPGIEVVLDDKPEIRMSEVLESFAEPLGLDDSEDVRTAEVKLGIAAAAWNAALLPRAERNAIITKFLDLQSGFSVEDRLEMRGLFRSLIRRKQALFADIRRMIVSFDVRRKGTGFHLTVGSAEIA